MKRFAVGLILAAMFAVATPSHAGVVYGLTPPVDDAGNVYNVPLSQWTVGGAFDSAYMCERVVGSSRLESDGELLRDYNSSSRPDRIPFAGYRARMQNSLCIASDDPRLAR
jgi:hypothetical protein